MHVFLTGATGFVGSYILKALRAHGHTVRCLMRDTSAALSMDGTDGIERVKGDILNPKSLVGVLRGCDAVIHLVGIIQENKSKGITFEAIHFDGTKNVVDAAREAEIETFVQMSANGAKEDGVSAYQTSKWQAEQYVKNAGFRHWTILRPSVIFGDPGPDNPEFCTQLASDLIKPFPILPVFGDGKYEMQPVAVENVAEGFVQTLETPKAINKTYCVGGQERFAYTDVLDIITRGLGMEPKMKLPQPLFLVRPMIHLIAPLGFLPITTDQFEMLLEGNTCDATTFWNDFALDPKPFTPENLGYLR